MSDVILQVAAKALIVNDKDEVLILREPEKGNVGSQAGKFGLVGGRINPEESFENALHREVTEEAGVKVKILYPIYVGEWYPMIKERKHHIVAIFNVCRYVSGKVKLSEEHDDYKWIKPQDVKKYPFMPPDDEVVSRYAAWMSKNLTISQT